MSNSAFPTPNANCWAKIDLDALGRNVRALQSLDATLMAVLKADAYGHGMAIVAPELSRLGVSDFGVATASEGAALRGLLGNKSANIYVMTATTPQDAEVIVENALTAFVSDEAALIDLSRTARSLGRTAEVHLEIDTGIGRAGILPEHFPQVLSAASGAQGIRLTGICTHFTCGEDAGDACAQHALFERTLSEVPREAMNGLIIHAANSPATLNVPGARYSMIRPGLLLYGIAPVGGAAPQLPDGSTLDPVLTLLARILLVRDLPAGTSISYGRTFILDYPARIATIGIGYGDGYSRRLSNTGSILLPSGVFAPIRGRVCMDQLCVELPPGENAASGDVVTLVGRAGDSELRAADIADSIDATPHEITTCLTQRVPRWQ